MLTRKQQWRRTRSEERPLSSIVPVKSPSKENAPIITVIKYPALLRSQSLVGIMRSSSSMFQLSQRRKTVRFSKTAKVCLIPSRKELGTLKLDLFWGPGDISQFKKDAALEIGLVATIRSISPLLARQALYQPSDKNDFCLELVYKSWRDSMQIKVPLAPLLDVSLPMTDMELKVAKDMKALLKTPSSPERKGPSKDHMWTTLWRPTALT